VAAPKASGMGSSTDKMAMAARRRCLGGEAEFLRPMPPPECLPPGAPPSPLCLAADPPMCPDAADRDQASPRIELRRHNRLSPSLVSSDTLVQVHDGILALEAVPAGGRRQILDFLMPGDAIPASVGVTVPGFFLRALTRASVERRSPTGTDGTPESWLEASAMLPKLRSHLMRRNLHQIMIGQLDTESRVSSFLLMLALRCCRVLGSNLLLPVPMSRNDIADYLAMNPDTLSRIMMRLEALRIIRRLDRHSLSLIDDHRLGQLSPIRALLLTTLGSAMAGELRPN
jgi:CRP/FNR family transcriptional regulator